MSHRDGSRRGGRGWELSRSEEDWRRRGSQGEEESRVSGIVEDTKCRGEEDRKFYFLDLFQFNLQLFFTFVFNISFVFFVSIKYPAHTP